MHSIRGTLRAGVLAALLAVPGDALLSRFSGYWFATLGAGRFAEVPGDLIGPFRSAEDCVEYRRSALRDRRVRGATGCVFLRAPF